MSGRNLLPCSGRKGCSGGFDNRRQVAAYAGLAPTPWQSGTIDREQGVSKSGNPRLRTTMVQLAWLWLRHQPRSALTLWFHERTERNGGRLRKTTIVALARKLAGCALEVCDRRRRDRRRYHESCLKPYFKSSRADNPGGSRWTNRENPWLQTPFVRMVSSS